MDGLAVHPVLWDTSADVRPVVLEQMPGSCPRVLALSWNPEIWGGFGTQEFTCS